MYLQPFMIPKRISLILLLAMGLSLPTTGMVTDSLRKVISTLKGEDKARAYVDLYMALYNAGEIDSALLCLDDLIVLRQQQDSIEKEGNARWSRIAILNNAARFEQLKKEAEIQMEWFKKQGIWNRFYQTWQRKCSALHDMGKVQTSLREAQRMQVDAKKRDNNIGRAMAYKQMGIIYYDLKQQEEARKAFSRAINILVKAKDDTGMLSGLYDFLCKTYNEEKKFNEELKITAIWLKHLDFLVKLRGVALVNGPLCSAHLARVNALIGLKRYEEAEKALADAEKYHLLYPTSLSKFYVNILRAEICLAKNQPAEALAHTDSIFDMGIEDTWTKEVRAEALQQLNRPNEAIALYKSLYTDHDSTYTREMRMQLDELNTLFKVDDLRMQGQLERSRFIIGIIALVVIVLLLFLYLHHRASLRLQKEHRLLLESNEKLEQSYQELQKANEKAEALSKMKTNFIQQISHEIRTPLNILSGFTQIITSSDMTLSQETRKDINDRINENTDRIVKLVNKMLALSDASTQTEIPCDDDVSIAQIATQAIENAQVENLPNIAFEAIMGEEHEKTFIHTNMDAAARALRLLLDNAKKFTKEGKISLFVDYQKTTVNFVVEDTGIGVPTEEAEHIFEEFVQLDTFYDGTGIGLTVARSIARRLGGDIWLDTSYSQGARFVYSLPVNTDES